MKTKGGIRFLAGDAGGWAKPRQSRGSLVVGAACGCDVSRLGVEVCEYLNHRQGGEPEPWRCFGSEEIRCLAGDAFWRGMILSAVPRTEIRPGCDGEKVARAIAGLGGAVLSGQTCLDATRGMDGVFRVVVARCGCPCGDDPELCLDPRRGTGESLVRSIGDRFLEWERERSKPSAGVRPDPTGRRMTLGFPAGEGFQPVRSR